MWFVWLAGQLCDCKFGVALCGMPRSLVLRDIGVLRNGIQPGGADNRVAPNWPFRSSVLLFGRKMMLTLANYCCLFWASSHLL